jgi:signal peptidase I
MRKLLYAALILLGIMGCLFIAGRITNRIQFYNTVALSNAPNITKGELVFASGLIQPRKLNFIAFKHTDSSNGEKIWIFRLCGIPGDTILLRNGTLFVNGENVDRHLNLYRYYILPVAVYETKYETDESSEIYGDSIFIPLQTTLDTALIKSGRKWGNENDPNARYQIKQIFQREWTPADFGPYIVPENKYFVLGDNRDIAYDSRFIGPIDQQDVVGTVLFKD